MKVIPTSLLFVELLIFFVVLFSSIISIVPDSCLIINDEKISDPAIGQYPSDLTNRLSKQVLPRKYVIAVAPDLQNNIFHGAIEITCELLQARGHVALHSKNLKVESTCLCSATHHRFCHPCLLEAVYPVPEYEMIVIKFTKILQPGIYTFRMNFSGRMDDGMNGFYLSTYTSSADDCTKRKLAVTQFEPTYARKAFPCFDEPVFKSIFDVKIIHPITNGYHAMSNMPALRVEKLSDRSDLAITCFASTLPMSTYSMAFLVSDFTCIASAVASLTGTSITVSVCSSLANKQKVRFALNVATKALDFYMKFFQIDYPLPKLDLVSVPDFAAGAMENWGLVTFRETEIVRSDEHSSVGNTKSVALTIAHELAHMWFGNLVTFEWWDDLWLNEGFATYMEYVAVEHMFPQWKQMECFALETKYLTMRSDAKISANPIIRRAENADEIGQMFDHISYQKGAAVIKMLEDVMGTAKFIGGIREYFLAYKFGNAATRELLEILQKHFGSEVNLIEFMKAWTESPGFPVLNIRRNTAAKYKIFQRRFLSHRSAVENSTWDLPIRYATSRKEDGVQLVWFSGNATCAELSLENPVDWIKLNHGSIGYYIVNYSEDLWCTFTELLTRDINVVNHLDRADLLHDAFVLADSGDAVYDVALNLTIYLVNESAFQPWVVAAGWILRVDRLLGGRPVHRGFRCYARRLIERTYRKVDWNVNETENFVTRELRILALRLACSIGHKDCLRVGEEKLRMFIESNGTARPPADLRSIIYSFGLVPLGPDHLVSYEKMWEIFIRENDPQEKERLLIGLADVREPAMIIRYLDRVADENLVRRQDFFAAIGKVASNPTGLVIVWNFVRNNWASLVKKYSLNDAAMGSFVARIVASFKEARSLNEAKEFFHEYPEAGAGANSRSLALEESASNVEWLTRNPEAIERWLEINGFWRKRERRCIQ